MPSGFHVASAWVDVDADTDPADRKIDALIAKLETIGGKKYEARIGADAGDALAAAAKVEAALAALDKAGARVHIGADMEGVRRDIADMSADLMMQTSMFREMGVAIGVMQRDLADVSADLMMQTGLLGEIRDKLTASAAAADVYNISIRQAGDATNRAAGTGFAGWGRFGRLLGGIAGTQIPLFSGALSAIPLMGAVGGVHLLIDGIAELAAVVIPATVAFAAFGAAAVPSVQDIVTQMQNLKTVTDATGQHLYPLTGGFQKVADAVRPQVYQIFGDALTVANKKTGEFQTLAKGAGTVLDQLAARMTIALTRGKGFGQFLQNAVPDLQQLGTVVANIGGTIGNFLKTMPGYAQVLLTSLVGVTHVLEVATGSGVAQGFLRVLLAAHGAALYVGMLATAGVKVLTGFGKFPGVLSLASDWLGKGALAAAKFGGEGNIAERALGGLSSKLSLAQGLPWGWISLGAAAVGVLAYKFITAKDAADNFIASFNQRLSVAPLGQVTTTISSGLTVMNSKLAAAKIRMDQLPGSILPFNRALAPIAPGLQNVANAFDKIKKFAPGLDVVTMGVFSMQKALLDSATPAASAVHDYQAYQAEITKLNQQSLAFHDNLGKLAVQFGGTGAAMGILTAAGITAKQMMDGSLASWAQIEVQVQGTINAYRAMGQVGGMLGADMNALTIAGSDQVTAMSKLNQAWDTTIGIVSGGQGAFITFQQSLLSVGMALHQTGGHARVVTDTFKGAAAAAKAAGASMNGINAPSLQLRATWQSAYANGAKLIDALRMMSSASPGGFPSLTQATKDVIGQMAPLGSLSGATRAELVSLAQEVNPGITNFKQLTHWLGNTKNAGQGLNSILAKSGINIQNLAADAAKMSNVFQSDVVSRFELSKLAANHVGQAIDTLNQAIAANGAKSPVAAAAAVVLANRLEKSGYSAKDAATLIAGMTGIILKVPTGHSTKFTVNDVQALSAINGVQVALSALKNHTVSIFVNTYGQTTATPAMRGTGGPGYAGATGGVIPGYAPGVDSVHAVLSPGEGILVPEAVRGIGGPQAIHALNRQFGGARVMRGNKTGTFASGGISTAASARFGFPAGDIFLSVSIGLPPATGPGPGYVTGATVQQIIDGLMNPHQRHQTKAQRAAAQQRVRAFEQAGLTPALEFAHGLTGITKIQAATKSAIDAIRKYYTGATMHRLISVISAQSKDLQNLAKRNDAVVAEMKAMKQYAASVTSNLGSSFSDLSNIQPMQDAKGNPIPVTGDYIASQLQLRLSRLKRFLGDIKLLAKDKLGKTLIGQVIALGPDAGVTYAEAILSGGSGLAATLRQVENEIGKVETQIGQKAAEIQYGQSISKGFLTGLQAQHSRLVREMRNLGDEIAMELARDFNDKNLLQRLRDQSSGGPGPGGFIPGHPPHHKGPGSGNGGGGIIQGHIPHHKGPGSGPHPPRKHAQPGAQPITINFQGTAFPSPEQVQSMKLALASAVSMA